MTDRQKITAALAIAVQHGGNESHHNAWVIDQMVRCLTGCDVAWDDDTVKTTGQPSPTYAEFVKEAKGGADGPDTYEWNEGIAP